MMMTSGQAVKYNGAIDCTRQILANEGFMSMMKGKLIWILDLQKKLHRFVNNQQSQTTFLCITF